MEASAFFASVLHAALLQVRAKAVPIFTFALYHDHESGAVSVCVDTEQSSNRSVLATNAYNMRYFEEAVAAGDLNAASLWQANIGRSLSLGYFEMINIARAELRDLVVNEQFYVAMVRALIAVQEQVAALSIEPASKH